MTHAKSRQDVVEDLLRRIQKGQDFPAFSEHISQVMQVVDDDESSMRHVTELILKDVGLTTKVLRTANTAQYNHSGRRLDTITHASAMLGLNAIRDLSGSMLLLQHFWKKSAGTKELLMLSLLSASQARAAARRVHYPNVEEAYLCGMYRNIGEVLVSAHLPRKYGAILKRIEEFDCNEQAASMRVLECSYEDVGRAATRLWNMPDRVRHCMQSGHSNVAGVTRSELDTLRTIVALSHRLTAAIHRQSPTGADSKLGQVVASCGKLLSLDGDSIREITKEAIDDTKATFDLLDVPLDDLRLREQTEAALAALERGLEQATEEETEEEILPGAEMLEQLTEEIELEFCTGKARDLNRMLEIALGAIARGAPFDRVLFGLVSPDRRLVRGRVGLGEEIDGFIDAFEFPVSIRSGPVAVALLGKQDVFVHDGRYANTVFGQTVRTTNFGLMPVIVDNVPLGVIYFDRQPEAPAPSNDIIHQLDRLRGLVSETIQLGRAQVGVAG